VLKGWKRTCPTISCQNGSPIKTVKEAKKVIRKQVKKVRKAARPKKKDDGKKKKRK